jgi:hypothetical protein
LLKINLRRNAFGKNRKAFKEALLQISGIGSIAWYVSYACYIHIFSEWRWYGTFRNGGAYLHQYCISLIRKLIPSKIRIAAYIVVIAGFVTIVDMLLKPIRLLCRRL